MLNRKSFFPPEEFKDRQRRVRRLMSKQGIDALLIPTPENIYYLCGLDHMGYFAYQMLILPLHGSPILISRAMEAATVADQVPHLSYYGYSDGSAPPPPIEETTEATEETPTGFTEEISGDVIGYEPSIRTTKSGKGKAPVAAVEETCRALSDAGLSQGKLALEQGGSFLSYRIANGIIQHTPDVEWSDGTGLVDQCRTIQSPLEIQCTRAAAIVSDAMILAGIAAAGAQVRKRDIMAAIYDAMFRRGGTYPGFVPLVRSTTSLVHEHGTWDDTELVPDDLLFLEMSGCVRRYHAPMGRLVFIERPPKSAYKAHDICQEAMLAAADAIKPGVRAGDVYSAWQEVLNKRGLSSYTRHHCGYSTGIGYPPSWSGGGVPVGLRAGSDLTLKNGMVFHLMSWLLRSDYGDSFLSDTILVTDDGCEFLTTADREVTIRM